MVPLSRFRTLLTVAIVIVSAASEARADWLFTPFIGPAFGTETSFLLLETGTTGGTSGTQLIFGGSAAYLSRGILGAEADFAYAPRFFERDNRAGNINGSNANTLSGSVIVAVPLSVTRESLRPYAVGGLGLMHAAAHDAAFNFSSFDDNFLGYNVGGGAIGLISPRTGFRFEIRHFRSVQNGETIAGVSAARLGFWRATVGVIIRLPS